MLPAYIYARFSSLEQAKGHSLERQLEEGRAHIERNGWEYCEGHELRDEGRSAFSGENRQPGSALYDFEQQTLGSDAEQPLHLIGKWPGFGSMRRNV